MTPSRALIRLIAAAARVTAGLKCPPLTTPNMTIRPNSRNAWTRPTAAKSEPNCAWSPVATNSTTTLVTKNTSKKVPISSARYAESPRSCTLLLLSPGNDGRRQSNWIDRTTRVSHPMRCVAALLAAAILASGTTGCGDGGAEPGAPVGATLMLDFTPNAAHSGIFAAAGQEIYDQEDVDLAIRQPGESSD